ncbi:putative polyketide synthase 44, partial [Dissostichus eleginoides]
SDSVWLRRPASYPRFQQVLISSSRGTDRNADKTITIKRFQTHSKERVLEAPSVSACVLRATRSRPIPPTTAASSALTGPR